MNDRDHARAALFSISPNLTYPEWFNAMCGARAAGLTVDDVDSWNSRGEKYPGRREIEKIFLNITPDGGIGPGTLVHIAKQYGYQENASHKPTHPPVKTGKQRSHATQPTQSISDSLAKVAENCELATASHSYIQKKRGLTDGVHVYRGHKTIHGQNCDGALVLTFSDLDEQPLGMQFIPVQGEKVNLPRCKFTPEACLVIGGPLSRGEKVYIVEGIAHAWSAHQATCAPAVVCFGKGRMEGVAEAIHARYPHLLLVIVPDGEGQQEAAEIARAVGGLYVDVPAEWPSTYDINDLHVETKSLAVVATLLESAKTPLIAEKTEIPPVGNTLNDAGNARRLVQRFGDDIRWLADIKEWMTWKEHRWEINQDGAIVRMAINTAKSIEKEAREEKDWEKVRQMGKWANVSQSQQRLHAMIELAKSQENITISSSLLDTHDMLLGTPSGVVDLQTGRMVQPSRQHYISKTTKALFRNGATCPRWMQFLNKCFAGSAEMINFIQRMLGYCLTGYTIEQVMFIFLGSGANGKSVFLETIRAVLGDYAMQAQSDMLMQSDGNRSTNDIARLRGARLVCAVEMDEGCRLAETQIKQLTGGDHVCSRPMYKEYFEYKPVCKIILAANHKPITRGNDPAMSRRIILIRFEVTIPEGKRDKHLSAKLAAESDGILQWMIEGCLEYQRIGLCPPAEITKATSAYKEEMDFLGRWLADCCQVEPRHQAGAQAAYDSYVEWNKQNGFNPVSQPIFSQRLTERGFIKKKKELGLMYLGFKLETKEPAPSA